MQTHFNTSTTSVDYELAAIYMFQSQIKYFYIIYFFIVSAFNKWIGLTLYYYCLIDKISTKARNRIIL